MARQRSRATAGKLARVASAAALAAWLASASAQTTGLTADCDGDGSVDFSETIRSISIALGRAPLADCERADRSGNGRIEIDEAVAGIQNAIVGATSDSPTPTREQSTPTASASATGTSTGTATITATSTATDTAATSPTGSATPEAPTSTPTTAPPPVTVTASATAPPTTTPADSPSPTRSPSATTTPTVTPTLGAARSIMLISPVFQVNTLTAGDQSAPGVCREDGGRFVVSWLGPQTGEVRAQQFADDGTRIGTEIDARDDAARCTTNGNSVRVFSGDDGDSSGVLAQRFSSAGQPLGTAFVANQSTAGTQYALGVCQDDSGDFVVAWTGPDGSEEGVFARGFESSGAPHGGDFQLNLVTSKSQSQARISCRADGGGAVIWNDASSSVARIAGRRLDAEGVPIGTEFATTAPGAATTLRTPDIAHERGGAFAVSWEAYRLIAGTNDPNRAVVQFYAADGAKSGGELQASTFTTTIQQNPTVAGIGDEFILVWEDRVFGTCINQLCSSLMPCSNLDFPHCRGGLCCNLPAVGEPQIVAHRFTSAGDRLGSEFQVSVATTRASRSPDVAADADGDMVVVWSTEQADGDGRGIFGRRYTTHQPTSLDFLAPCEGNGDRWTFAATAGRQVTVRVDTIDAATSADLCFRAECGGVSVVGDDESPCAFAPSSFACPLRTFTAPADGECAVTVATCSRVCAEGMRANYALVVDADGAPLPLTLADQNLPITPTGTPKRTPTPTPTATRRAGEALALDVAVYRALDDKLTVVIPGIAGRRIRITSLAIAAGGVVAQREAYAPGAPDVVVTALAGALPDTLLPLDAIRSAGVLRDLTSHPSVEAPVFDRCAIGGAGLLTLPGGRQATSLGGGPYAPMAPSLTPLGAPSAGVPAAIRKRVTRRIDSATSPREAIAFPAPGAAECAGASNDGTPCAEDPACSQCTQVGQGCCGRASRPPGCSANPGQICDPAEPGSCFGVGICNRFGGEVDDQTMTFDDELDTLFGNPPTPGAETDGILLEGECAGAGSPCDALVLLVDAGPSVDLIQVAAAGFVLDSDERVVGTAGGIGNAGSLVFPGSEVSCDRPREFLLSFFNGGDQTDAALCHTPAGDLVSVWTSNGIRGQRFAGSGAALGGELPIRNTAGAAAPSVCCRPDAGFVVAWSESGRDGSSAGIFGRRFSSAGSGLGTEFQVNSYTPTGQYTPDVVCQGDGGFVVAWMSGTLSSYPPGQDGSAAGVYAQRYAGDGNRTGGEFRANVQTFDPQGLPQACRAENGDFVLSWFTRNASSFRPETVTRRFSAAGSPLTGDISNPSTFADFQFEPDVACTPAGEYLVVYRGQDAVVFPNPSPGADGNGDGIFGRLYSNAGVPLGSELRINTTTSGDQATPIVTADGLGGFLVVWTSPGQDGSDLGIIARRFTGSGAPAGTEIEVNTVTSGPQSEAAASCDADGECFVAWTSADGSGTGVFGLKLP